MEGDRQDVQGGSETGWDSKGTSMNGRSLEKQQDFKTWCNSAMQEAGVGTVSLSSGQLGDAEDKSCQVCSLWP